MADNLGAKHSRGDMQRRDRVLHNDIYDARQQAEHHRTNGVNDHAVEPVGIASPPPARFTALQHHYDRRKSGQRYRHLCQGQQCVLLLSHDLTEK